MSRGRLQKNTGGTQRQAQEQPGLPLNLNNTINFKLFRHVKIATALAVCCSARLGHTSFTFELKTRKKTLIAQLSLFFIKTPQSFDSVSRRNYSPFVRCYRPESVGTRIAAQGQMDRCQCHLKLSHENASDQLRILR